MRIFRAILPAALIAFMSGPFGFSAQPMPPAQQTALVQKYCAVCHTDQAKNGGLSLQHYDAAETDPALAAMLLTKLRNGAMGAAGLGIPDPATREAWVEATTAQAAQAKQWTVRRDSKASTLSASIVRDVPPRIAGADAPVYRITLKCDTANRKGEMQLTWSPAPRADRTFTVTADGHAPIPHTLMGREEAMGNGVAATTGLASAILNVPLPERVLSINDLFPGETVVFPIGELSPDVRRQLAACQTTLAARGEIRSLAVAAP